MTEMEFKLVKAKAFLSSQGLSRQYQIFLRQSKQYGEYFALVKRSNGHQKTVLKSDKIEEVFEVIENDSLYKNSLSFRGSSKRKL